jgi:hypothetical protein
VEGAREGRQIGQARRQSKSRVNNELAPNQASEKTKHMRGLLCDWRVTADLLYSCLLALFHMLTVDCETHQLIIVIISCEIESDEGADTMHHYLFNVHIYIYILYTLSNILIITHYNYDSLP